MIEKDKKLISKMLLVLSIGFVVYGAYRDEVNTVLSKAVKLCLECIGIG